MPNCTAGNTFYERPGTGQCQCTSNYYGDHCEFEYPPIVIAFYWVLKVAETLTCIFPIVWILLYLIGKYRSSKYTMLNIGTGSNILNLISTTIELVLVWITAPLSSDSASFIVYLIFFYVAIILLQSSGTFILAFWVDVLGAKKFSFKLRNGTKIFIISFFVVGVIIAIAGGIYGILGKNTIVSLVLVIAVLIINVLIIIGYSSKIMKLVSQQSLKSDNGKKILNARRISIINMVGWILYILTLCLQEYFNSAGLSSYNIITDYLYTACRRIISISLIFYFDSKGKFVLSVINNMTVVNSDKVFSSTTLESNNTTINSTSNEISIKVPANSALSNFQSTKVENSEVGT